MWKTRTRLGCNALRLGGRRGKNFILSDSGPRLLIAPMRRNLVAVVLVTLAVAQGWALVDVLRFVFGGEFEKAFLGQGIAGRARQAPASVGLLS
jgi:hypothetical protein